MCGIGGLIGIRDEGAVVGRRLLAALLHRGPDDQGLEQPLPTVTLVHTRLAILDLSSAGHQPMRDHLPPGLKPNWVVFNGEIYNFRELQRDVAAAGWICHTACDTEVLLYAYRAWGEECVARLRGMFAFCLVDPARGIAHLYRDRLGIKPLYLYRPPQGGLIFASELRAILSLGGEVSPARINPRALEGYLAQGAVQGYESLIEGVSMLRPGSHLAVDLGTGEEISRRSYWELPAPKSEAADHQAEVEKLRHLAREAVAMHLVSDAPLGIFLSSGIDSTALLALAAEAGASKLHTLTVGFDGGGDDESRAAAEAARAFGTEHRTMPLAGATVSAMLDEGLAAMDQPTVDGFNTYFVSRSARQAGLTVALSGLGGDELFGGYASFTDVPRVMALRQRPIARWVAGAVAPLIRNRFGAKLGEALRRDVYDLPLYLLRRELFLPGERRALQPLPPGADPVTGMDETVLDEVRRQARRLDGINRISLFELQLYMCNMLLRDSDAFSMAAPIEYRVPLLDHVLVEAVFALPGSWKKPDPRPKPLLIDLAGDRLPPAVWKRSKRGFAFPWGRWLAAGGPLHERARDAVSDKARWSSLGMTPSAVVDVWSRFDRGDRRVSPLQVLAFVSMHDFAARHGICRA
jgi:asparagine synthase (glutamine-hydrolysing)